MSVFISFTRLLCEIIFSWHIHPSSLLHQAGSWRSSTLRPLSLSAAMTGSDPTRVSSLAFITMGSRFSTWLQRATPTSRWMAACGWWATCPRAGVRHAPPPRYHQRCPPLSSRPPPPCLLQPLENSALHLPFRYDPLEDEESVWHDESLCSCVQFYQFRFQRIVLKT